MKAMLSAINNISISFEIQQYKCNKVEISEETNEIKFELISQAETEGLICKECGHQVHVYGISETYLKDMPLSAGSKTTIRVLSHRYRCPKCGETYTESSYLRYPGTRVTWRLADFIEQLLRAGLTTKSVSIITGVHWDTVRKIHKDFMDNDLKLRDKEIREQNYKPKYLAVDEFSIHKGHTYATCVMDLEVGEIIWVGKGRSMADFQKFFLETDMKYLSEVEAVAMDMNASYNRLVEEYLPRACIVYDRYHMQAQFGKDVLGAVRLSEARAHKEQAMTLAQAADESLSKSDKKEIKLAARAQRKEYSQLKSARWTLLRNSDNLTDHQAETLKEILDNHSGLALCYAMKEEMCELFSITDEDVARERWTAWFEAAKASGIEPLAKFARIKEKRIEGLIAHAVHPISTGKLEGLNNKIKVAKRIGYGYRDDEYFFTLIRFMTLPPLHYSSHKFP